MAAHCDLSGMLLRALFFVPFSTVSSTCDNFSFLKDGWVLMMFLSTAENNFALIVKLPGKSLEAPFNGFGRESH